MTTPLRLTNACSVPWEEQIVQIAHAGVRSDRTSSLRIVVWHSIGLISRTTIIPTR
jgi:hypothetical protein